MIQFKRIPPTRFFSSEQKAQSAMRNVYEKTNEQVYVVERKYGQQFRYSEWSVRTHSQMFFKDSITASLQVIEQVEPEQDDNDIVNGLNPQSVENLQIAEWKRQARYYDFHFANQGYMFQNFMTGQILDKLAIFNRYFAVPQALEYLTAGKHRIWNRIEKKEWKNGKLVLTNLKKA